MNESELPDDPKAWPNDPFELLGVKPGADETVIRRAYTRLIRRFKPEHFPEQFRIIREAYETCLIRRHWYAPEPDDAPASPFIRVIPTDRVEIPVEKTDEPIEVVKPPKAATRDEGQRLWNIVVGGGLFESYAGLEELNRAQPERPDVPLQLYWLLAVNPELDAERTRHDWLAEALKRSHLSGTAAELFRRELEADAWAGVKECYRDLLSTEAPTADLLRVARWRVAACGKSGGWQATVADLEVLKRVLPFQDEPAWLGLLVFVYEWVAWAQVQPVFDTCREELSRLRHLELTHSYSFDRIDATDQAARLWQLAESEYQPREVLALMPWSWAGQEYLWPEAVHRAVSSIAEDPIQNLGMFDRFIEGHGPGLVLYLTRVLERFHWDHGRGSEPAFEPDVVRGLVRVMVSRQRFTTYEWMRNEILKRLIEEVIDPDELVAACLHHPDYAVRTLAVNMQRDVSLRLVWLAARLDQGMG